VEAASASLHPSPLPAHVPLPNPRGCSAIEETTIADRAPGRPPLPQDAFVAAHMKAGDVVIVSMGGNDVVLKPTPRTIVAMLWLAKCASLGNITAGAAS
jgi:hypothetical protein